MIIDTPDWDLNSLTSSVIAYGSNNEPLNTTVASVYEPSEDTFLVLDALQLDLEHTVRDRLLCQSISDENLSSKNEPLLVVELGCGAGLLSAAVSKALRNDILTNMTDIGVHCVAVDINPAACHATARTCFLNSVQVDVVCGDLLSWMRRPESTHINVGGVHPGILYGPVDLLLFNPPYVRGPDGECATAPISLKIDTKENSTENQLQSKITDAAWLGGGPDGVEILKKALHQAADLLSERGVFYVLMIDYNYAALVREEMNSRCERVADDFEVIGENNSTDYLLLTTFGSGTMKKPLACHRIISRQVPGEKLSVYRLYRPHILDLQ